MLILVKANYLMSFYTFNAYSRMAKKWQSTCEATITYLVTFVNYPSVYDHKIKMNSISLQAISPPLRVVI